jgi:hypothetical protein
LTTAVTNPYVAAFPKWLVARPEQARFLEVMPQFASRDVLAAVPTGVGKSALAVATMVAEGGGYLVSPQTAHVDQFAASFSFLRPGQASSSHLCIAGGLEATCRDTQDSEERYCDRCPYAAQRDAWMRGPLSVSTLAYFFQRAQHPEKEKRPERRPRLAIDEAHALERCLVDYEGYTCTAGQAKILKVELPLHPDTEDPAIRHPALQRWLAMVLVPAQVERLRLLRQEIAVAKHCLADASKQNYQEALDLVRRLRRERNSLDSDCQKCEQLAERPSGTFVAWSQVDPRTKRPGQSPLVTGVAIKPLEVRSAFRRLIRPYGDRLLLMSATLYPALLVHTLGIQKPGPDSPTGYFTCPSPFPRHAYG